MDRLPKHIAVIPDGNRRWAKLKSWLPWKGHEEGAKRFEEAIRQVFDLGVPYFTFWAGSEDNLTKRTEQEVYFLAKYLREGLEKELASQEFLKRGIRFQMIGRWREILKNEELNKVVDRLEFETKNCEKHFLTVLFGYDGKSEMISAIEGMQTDPLEKVDYSSVKRRLWTADLPPVDLVIRTGGEPHWSAGFLMWHTTDSQLYFTEKLWPDFDGAEMKKALEDYAGRERRMGR